MFGIWKNRRQKKKKKKRKVKGSEGESKERTPDNWEYQDQTILHLSWNFPVVFKALKDNLTTI